MGCRYQGTIWIYRYASLLGHSLLQLRAVFTVNYLRDYRLQWGKPDTLSLLHSRLDDPTKTSTSIPNNTTIPHDTSSYFTVDTPPELISIIMNDWPYSGARPHKFALIPALILLLSPSRDRALTNMDSCSNHTYRLTSFHRPSRNSGRFVGFHGKHFASTLSKHSSRMLTCPG